jgi:hypothetical protein
VSDEIDRRLRIIEDRLAIADLIARYGPAADAGDAEAVGALWDADGDYRFDDVTLVGGEVGALVDREEHRALLADGCAHVLSAPRIDLDGDTAVAVSHSVVLRHVGASWLPVRVSANRWELVRRPDGWRVAHRRNALLDGAETARALLS